MVEAKLKWAGGLKFEGTGAFGHKIVTDGARKAGGNEEGYKPTELLLFGLISCSGVDVVRILEKQRQQLTSLELEAVGEHGDEYPKPMHTIRVKYTARGKDLNPDKLAKAIELSETKYCMVGQTIERETKIISEFEIISEKA